MTLILYSTIFHTVEHLTEPKHFPFVWSLYNLFDEKVLYYDRNSYLAIKSLQGRTLQKKLDKSLCASGTWKSKTLKMAT